MSWVFITVSMGFAGNWSQWRGPSFDGTCDEVGLIDELSPKTLLWQKELSGLSAATPVVFDGKLYVVTTSGKTSILGLCADAATGQTIWQRTLTDNNQRYPQGNTNASCSPCADKTGVVFYCGDGTLVKFDSAGNQLWKRNLVDDYGPFTVGFGYSSSPLLLNSKLYIPVMRYPEDEKTQSTNLDSYLVCIDAATGKNIFYQVRNSDTDDESTNAYNTPVPATINGIQQVVLYCANFLTGHDLETGAELWRCRFRETPSPSKWGRVVSTPIVNGDMIYCAYPEGYKAMAYNLKEVAAGKYQREWTFDARVSDSPSPTLVDGHLYFIEERKKELICLEAKTGTVKWTGQLDKSDQYYASVTAADGKLYMVNRKGVVTVAAADPTAFRVISTHEFGGRPADSTIIIAHGKLYLRTAETLYCFSRKE